MAQLIRLRNDSALPQVVYLRGDAVRIPVGGTVLADPESYLMRISAFTRIGTVGEPDPAPAGVVDVAALHAEIAALKAQLAQPAEPEAEPYPRHLGGGKWELSSGEVTKGGLSREAAETLERETGA